MKSLDVVFAAKSTVEVEENEVGEPGHGEIVFEATKSLISTGTECIVLESLHEPGTHWAGWGKFPFHPGYSIVGQVAAVGPDVTTVKVGDRVAARAQHRKRFVVAASDLYPIPNDVADDDASWFALASIAQTGVRKAAHELGDTVVIVGLGPLGQLLTQYVSLMGASEIIAVDLSPDRLALAAAHGATRTLQMGVADAHQAVSDLTKGRMADVVYDVTGHPAVFADALKLPRTFGKVIILGDTGTPSQQHLTVDVITRGLTILGAHDGNPPLLESPHAHWTKPNMVALFFKYLERGQMRTADLITHRFDPRQAQEAYTLLVKNRSVTMGALFDWTGVA